MMKVVYSEEFPDSTYFRLSDVTPRLSGDTLTVYDGEGSRRGWGRPGVTSTVVLNEDDLVAVHVGFYHKHGGGQGWFFYRPQDGNVKRVYWRALNDQDRQRILKAAQEHAPSWAKSPGKLKEDRVSPKSKSFTAYKVVHVTGDGEYTSLHDPDIRYTVGKTYREKALPHHQGGYYVYTSQPGRLIEDFRAGRIAGTPDPGNYAVLETEAWGRRIGYAWSGEVADSWIPAETVKKWAVTYIKPTAVLLSFTVDN